MKLNNYVFKLLTIFAGEFDDLGDLHYRYYKEVDVSSHLILEQDQPHRYYLSKTQELLLLAPRPVLAYEQVSWQIREVYRLVNTAIASSDSTLAPYREKLATFKKELEKDDYLANFLKQLANIPTDLVCSGHGTYFYNSYFINLSFFIPRTQVIFYSGLGGILSERLGVDIENEQFKPENVVVHNLYTHKKEEGRYPSMFFFSSAPTQPNVIPDLTMVDCNILPHPRVIEPATGRVLHGKDEAEKNENSFSLSTVLQKFPGRSIHWAACTGIMLPDGQMVGPSRGLFWDKEPEETPCLNPPKRKRVDLSEQQPNSILS